MQEVSERVINTLTKSICLSILLHRAGTTIKSLQLAHYKYHNNYDGNEYEVADVTTEIVANSGHVHIHP